MAEIEVNPKEQYSQLKAFRDEKKQRLISEALGGAELTKAQTWQLGFELESSTRWEGTELLPVNELGVPLTDPHGHDITISDFIRQTAEGLGFTGRPKQQAAVTPPKDTEEYFQRMRAAQTPDERIAIMESWERQQKKK